MFLTPACLIAGRQRLALDFTSAYGFEPILIRYVELSSAQVAAIWRYQIPGFDPLRWQVALRLFTAGPGLLVVMRQKAPRAPSAARHLKALKGPSDPAQCQAYHLRTRLGAMNKINNLVHSPDDPWDVVRELEIFLPAGELLATWQAVRAPNGFVVRRSEREEPDAPERSLGVSFVHVALHLGRRIAATLRDLGELTPDQLASIQMPFDQAWSWVAQRSSAQPFQVLESYRRSFPRPLLVAIDQSAAPTLVVRRLLDAIQELSSALVGDPSWRSTTIVDALAGTPCALDDWDALVLSTQDVARGA
jgi:hypothetical protein